MIESEYGIKTKPAYSGNPQANTIMERVHKDLGNLLCSYNLQETYVDDAYLWKGTLETAAFVEQYTYHRENNKVQAGSSSFAT